MCVNSLSPEGDFRKGIIFFPESKSWQAASAKYAPINFGSQFSNSYFSDTTNWTFYIRGPMETRQHGVDYSHWKNYNFIPSVGILIFGNNQMLLIILTQLDIQLSNLSIFLSTCFIPLRDVSINSFLFEADISKKTSFFASESWHQKIELILTDLVFKLLFFLKTRNLKSSINNLIENSSNDEDSSLEKTWFLILAAESW